MRPDRRALLQRAAAAAIASVWAGRAAAQARLPGAPSALSADPFALGVAAGDPGQTGATIWTRLIGAGLAPLREPMSVRWEVAEDEGFRHIVRAGGEAVAAATAHAAHVDIIGLRAGRDYFYRFMAGGAQSPVGRLRTLPESTQSFRIALTACQHWEHGYFSAYLDLLKQAPDLVLQVGDYIYEKSFGDGPNVRRFPRSDPLTLSDYRARHALYKTDPHLKAAHAAAAWLLSPDDHEVENDYAGGHSPLEDPAAFMRRRAAAYQAYLEHAPISLSRRGADALRLHGKFEIGKLARLYLLDTRQHRSAQAGAPEARALGSLQPISSPALRDPKRTMLGPAQESWLRRELSAPQPIWSIVAQQTLLASLRIVRDREPVIWSDIWDGYPLARARLLQALSGETVNNALVLSGDVHSFWRNRLLYEGRHIGEEIVTSCLASRNGPDALFKDAQAANSHIRFLDNAHSGYALADINERRVRVDFRAVASLIDPNAPAFSLYTDEIFAKS